MIVVVPASLWTGVQMFPFDVDRPESVMASRRTLFFAFALLLASASSATAGVLTPANGLFTDGTGNTFTGWTTFDELESPLEGSDGDRFVRFEEVPGSLTGFTQIEQTIVIPTTATILSFDFLIETNAPPSAVATFKDTFQATLFDSTRTVGLLPSGVPGLQPGFFSQSFDGDTFKHATTSSPVAIGGTGPRASWETVSVDVSSLRGQTAILDFTLISGFDFGITTSVNLDNVVIATQSNVVVPEPTSATLAAMLGLCGACFTPRRRRR